MIPDHLLARLNRPIIIAGMASVILVLTAATGYHIYLDHSVPNVEYDRSRRGMSDFHYGTYLPSLAFRHGESPYTREVADRYEICRQSPPYSPVLFVLHVPITWMQLHVADVFYFAFTFLMLMSIAWCGIRMSGRPVQCHVWLLLIILLLFSRPGQNSLYTGYFTAEMVLGTVLALHLAKSRPLLSGLGMMVASYKPTYIIPLIILLLFRRNFKAVMWGIIFCGLGGMIGWWWLARESSFLQVLEGVWQGQTAHLEDVTAFPINAWTRVDLLGMLSKFMNWHPGSAIILATMSVLLAFPAWVLWRTTPREANPGATGLTSFIIVLTMLLGVYHHAYDCLLLAVPWIGIALYGRRTLPELNDRQRIAVVILTAVPAVNYLSTLSSQTFLNLDPLGWTWQSITVINGLCLLAALLILLVAALNSERQPQLEAAPNSNHDARPPSLFC